MSTEFFVKWNLCPEEIKGEDNCIQRWLQEKYGLAVTDTVTTDYHFQCDIKILDLFVLQYITENTAKAIAVVFSFKKT